MEPAFGTKVKAGKRGQKNAKGKKKQKREKKERMTDSYRHTYWEVRWALRVTRRN